MPRDVTVRLTGRHHICGLAGLLVDRDENGGFLERVAAMPSQNRALLFRCFKEEIYGERSSATFDLNSLKTLYNDHLKHPQDKQLLGAALRRFLGAIVASKEDIFSQERPHPLKTGLSESLKLSLWQMIVVDYADAKNRNTSPFANLYQSTILHKALEQLVLNKSSNEISDEIETLDLSTLAAAWRNGGKDEYVQILAATDKTKTPAFLSDLEIAIAVQAMGGNALTVDYNSIGDNPTVIKELNPSSFSTWNLHLLYAHHHFSLVTQKEYRLAPQPGTGPQYPRLWDHIKTTKTSDCWQAFQTAAQEALAPKRPRASSTPTSTTTTGSSRPRSSSTGSGVGVSHSLVKWHFKRLLKTAQQDTALTDVAAHTNRRKHTKEIIAKLKSTEIQWQNQQVNFPNMPENGECEAAIRKGLDLYLEACGNPSTPINVNALRGNVEQRTAMARIIMSDFQGRLTLPAHLVPTPPSDNTPSSTPSQGGLGPSSPGTH